METQPVQEIQTIETKKRGRPKKEVPLPPTPIVEPIPPPPVDDSDDEEENAPLLKPKRVLSEAQKAALAKGREAGRK